MQSELISSEEITRLFRLIHDLCELGTDPMSWRLKMLDTLGTMISAPMQVSYLMGFSLDPQQIGPQTLLMLELGTNSAWKKYREAGDLRLDPVTRPIMERFGTNFTVMRSDFVDDESFFASEYCRTVARPSDMGDAVYSQVAINDPKVVDGLGFCRSWSQPRFTRRDVRLVQLFHEELSRLWNRPDPIGTHLLPDRQREVLESIRRGLSRKTIAEKMKISEHTVHTYEKALFERASVSSRGELIASLANTIRPNLLP